MGSNTLKSPTNEFLRLTKFFFCFRKTENCWKLFSPKKKTKIRKTSAKSRFDYVKITNQFFRPTKKRKIRFVFENMKIVEKIVRVKTIKMKKTLVKSRLKYVKITNQQIFLTQEKKIRFFFRKYKNCSNIFSQKKIKIKKNVS